MNKLSKIIFMTISLGFLSACEPVTTWRVCMTATCNWPYNDGIYVAQPVSTGLDYQAYECARERKVVRGLGGAMMYHD